MNLITTNTAVTMTSLEISELVEKRHDNVKRTIEKLAEKGVIRHPQIEVSEKNNNLGLPTKVKSYVFDSSNKRDTYIVVAQLSPEFTARLVDRWQELEAQTVKPIDPIQTLNDPAAMRGLLLNYTEKVLALEEEKKILTPKAEALDRISTADGTNCITDTAKILQVRPKELFSFLSSNKWIYRRPGGKGWIAYQEKIQQGLVTHKVTTVTDVYTGKERIIEQVLVTAKGLAKISSNLIEVAA